MSYTTCQLTVARLALADAMWCAHKPHIDGKGRAIMEVHKKLGISLFEAKVLIEYVSKR